jgi:hypothetical protein
LWRCTNQWQGKERPNLILYLYRTTPIFKRSNLTHEPFVVLKQGVLTMPNGDRIEGTFQGQWNEGLKINGMYIKGTAPPTNTTALFSER